MCNFQADDITTPVKFPSTVTRTQERWVYMY